MTHSNEKKSHGFKGIGEKLNPNYLSSEIHKIGWSNSI